MKSKSEPKIDQTVSWEYKSTDARSDNAWNDLGALGWELVGFTGNSFAVFKRKINV